MASKKAAQEQIVAGFNELRQKQQAVAGKLSELEVERREFELILETLKGVDKDRRAFQMMGGVLFEKKAGEVVPSLQQNIDNLSKVITTLESQLKQVGAELVEYRQKHGVKLSGEEPSHATKENESRKSDSKAPGLLV